MSTTRPPEIRASHLARRAVVYVRQSTDLQVVQHQGSTEYQRGQARYASAWGWPADAIEIVDEDLGLTGSATAHRRGYGRLVEGVRAGTVGAIFISDLTRIGREAIAWFELLNDCATADGAR